MESPRLEAAKTGAMKYSGGECKICGSIVRYTSNGACVKCALEKSKLHHMKVKELIASANSEG